MHRQKHYQGLIGSHKRYSDKGLEERGLGKSLGRQRKRRKWANSFSLNTMRHKMGIVGCGGLMFLLVLMLCPTVDAPAQAEELTTRVDTTSRNISVSLAGELELDVSPTAEGNFVSKTTDLYITTNNPTGYELFLSTVDGNNALTEVSHGTAKIEAIAADTAKQDFLANTWGYSLLPASAELTDETLFQPVPGTRTSVKTTEGATNDAYQLVFATKVDTNLLSGQYSNTILASVVANPETVSDLTELTYMQDITPEICAHTDEGTEVKLTDSRDGKDYYVAKLKDGNCWMTQNLAYDLVKGEVLTSNDTDVVEDWEVPTDTEKKIPAAETPVNTAVRSWNLGEIIALNPTEGKQCGASVPSTSTLIAYCSEYYKNVAGMTEGYKTTMTSSVNGETYDGHYLIGNYYTWNAATAGTGAETDTLNKKITTTKPETFINATGSVCPKGWSLPVAGGSAGNSEPVALDRSFYKMILNYGYSETTNSEIALWGDGITRVDYRPVSLVRSGQIVSRDGNLSHGGILGKYWSSTAYPNDTGNSYGYTIQAGKSIISGTVNLLYPIQHLSRWMGVSVRCLAR